jgi:SpoVK/Ycf46/Vps4 family AAA+-type ATPase
MARGDLMKKLLASYGRDEEFRSIALQIIEEEEKKNNRVLARSLRRTLDEGHPKESRTSRPLAPLIPFPDAVGDLLEKIEPTHSSRDIVLSAANFRQLAGLVREFRRADEIRRRGLTVRSKLLFCGPPGCGKTLCAEVFARELGLPLFVAKLDAIISSYLGETATNIRKIFESTRRQPCVLFLDEFDALARSREDSTEHNELRRVVNSLLVFIDRIRPNGFLIAATNLETTLDTAVWRRFDEVIWFDKPDLVAISRFIRLKFRNVEVDFTPSLLAPELLGFSFADIERVCIQAIKASILDRRRTVSQRDFRTAIFEEQRRQARSRKLSVAE